MKMNEINSLKRKCIITNQIIEISKLIRFDYKKATNILKIDWDKNMNGRGAYFVPEKQNWEKIKKTRALNRIFKTNFTFELYLKLEPELEEKLWAKKHQD
ncbi:YlxR family protein [Mycoplasmopsis cynos]|nr:YlxR family protein [Mycoplasmopsis cynos]WQQ13180.1 YlxR family protein [Mycoplasmopsis cynos]